MNCIDYFTGALPALGTIIALIELAHQMKNERRARNEEQAKKIATWLGDEWADENSCGDTVVLFNGSDCPVYEVAFSIDDLEDAPKSFRKGDEACSCIEFLPPGKYIVEVEFLGRGMCRKFNSSVSFRDHCGTYWTRDARGILIKHKKKANIESIREVSFPYSSTLIRRIE